MVKVPILSIISQNILLSLTTEGIVTYMLTKKPKVAAVYTVGNFASYVFRDTYRDYSDKLISKFSVGFIGGVIKYSITKTLIDFAGINQVPALEQKILKPLLLVKIMLGGVNHGCYEAAIIMHKNVPPDKYNISSTLYWHTVPHAIELLEAYSNNLYITNFLPTEHLSEQAQALMKLTSIRELIDGTFFYNALVGFHCDTNFTGLVKDFPLVTAAAFYNFGKQSYYFNGGFVAYASLRYAYHHHALLSNNTKSNLSKSSSIDESSDSIITLSSFIEAIEKLEELHPTPPIVESGAEEQWIESPTPYLLAGGDHQ